MERPNEPTWAMVDIDPGESTTFDDVVMLAKLHRIALDQLGLIGCPKVSGRRGIHVWIPVATGYTFADTRAFVERLSHLIGDAVPELVSWKWEKSKRDGLVRLDFTQNAVNKTLVAPFSVRSTLGAPVSVPITWDELDDPDLAPDRWTINTIGERLASVGDSLAPHIGRQQQLPGRRRLMSARTGNHARHHGLHQSHPPRSPAPRLGGVDRPAHLPRLADRGR